jgi:hypothetical protein
MVITPSDNHSKTSILDASVHHTIEAVMQVAEQYYTHHVNKGEWVKPTINDQLSPNIIF